MNQWVCVCVCLYAGYLPDFSVGIQGLQGHFLCFWSTFHGHFLLFLAIFKIQFFVANSPSRVLHTVSLKRLLQSNSWSLDNEGLCMGHYFELPPNRKLDSSVFFSFRGYRWMYSYSNSVMYAPGRETMFHFRARLGTRSVTRSFSVNWHCVFGSD